MRVTGIGLGVFGLLLALPIGSAIAQVGMKSADEMERALMPNLPAEPAERTRSFKTRGISSVDPETTAKYESKPLPLPIQFEKDSADLTDEGKKQLDLVAESAGKVKTRTRSMGYTPQLNIVGHASREGDPAHNKALSERRAQAARDYFIKYWGYRPDEFAMVQGRGSADSLPSKTGYEPENRRVEFGVIATTSSNR
jgi:outer membrane protein OmpA-like peptidoglycan-associated protein